MKSSVEQQIVVQTRRGLSRPEDRIPLSSVNIPDMWSTFKAMSKVAQEIRKESQEDDDKAEVIERANELAKATWDIAHDMRRCLQETVAPAISEALSVLESLRAEAEVRALNSDDIQRAINALSKAFEDGQRGR